MFSRAIVLFTGDPKREAVRKGLPRGVLGTLHGKLIETIRRRDDTALVIASDSAGQFLLSSQGRLAQSAATTLGDKIAAAYRFAFELGSESVLVLAGDVAGVDDALLDDAFRKLELSARTCVLGPSGDGGFYLLGLNRSGGLASSIEWNRIPWFTAASSGALARVLCEADGRVLFGERIDDIDSLADALRVTNRLSRAFLKLRARLQSLLVIKPTDSVPPQLRHSVDLHSHSLLRGPPRA